MPIDFGNTGRNVPGVGVLLTEKESAGFLRQEQRKMGEGLDRMTIRDLDARQVYIFNVGPFRRMLTTLGSTGAFVIDGLPESQVLKGLSVTKPWAEQARPESYPSEPPGRVLMPKIPLHLKWKDADGEEFVLADRPAIDKALRIIGGHQDSKKNQYAASPYEQGCFVSTIPEQTAPPKELKDLDSKASPQARREYAKAFIQYEEDLRLWLKWESSVQSAQKRFEAWALRRGEEQSLAFSNGSYVRDEELYVLARILGKTVDDWKFLAGTSSNTKTVPCWACKRPVEVGALRCPAQNCGELQVTQAEYEKIRAARMAGTAA